MTQEEILKEVEAYRHRYGEWRKENDKLREYDNSFPYYEEGYESGFSDVIYFLRYSKWPLDRL